MSIIKNQGRSAGLWYLSVIIFGIGAEVIRSSLFISTDIIQTTKAVLENDLLFRLGFIMDIIMMLSFIFVGLRFYFVLKPTNINYATALLVFVLLGVAINMGNLNNHFKVLTWLTDPQMLKQFGLAYVQQQAQLTEGDYRAVYNIANVFFGLWLLPLGMLIYKSKIAPKIVGILAFIAGLGFLIDTLAKIMLPSIAPSITTIATIQSIIGEFSITIWFIIKGSKSK